VRTRAGPARGFLMTASRARNVRRRPTQVSFGLNGDFPAPPCHSYSTLSSTPRPTLAEKAAPSRLRITLAVTLLLTAALSVPGLKRGWRPHDDGLLAQSAERVLQGELPHRDFDDAYTGGLSFLNALAFRAFGETLAAPRYLLLIFFLFSSAATFYIASQFGSPAAAAGITLLAAAWSVPAYPAAMPSWYNLFFALFGVAALLRFFETDHPRWTFLAGLCAGCSIAIKISGLYFVAAALLFFIAREQGRRDSAGRAARSRAYSLFVASGLVLFLALLLRLWIASGRAAYLLLVFAPAATVAIALARAEVRGGAGHSADRFAALLRDLAPFFAGVALPLLVLLVPYLVTGSTAALVHGVFVSPLRRTQAALWSPLPPRVILYSLPPILLLIAAARWRNRLRAPLLAAVGIALALVLASPLAVPAMWPRIWMSFGASLPIAVPLALLPLGRASVSDRNRHAAFLLVAAAALCSLIQFPYAAPVYFHYAAPLVLLAAFAVASFCAPRPALAWALGAFYFLFAVAYDSQMFIDLKHPLRYPDRLSAPLPGPRAGGTRVRAEEARQYEQLLPLIQAHAGAGDCIYAGPDAPEVYFLAGKRNPTRLTFDFLSDEPPATVVSAIEHHDVRVAVIRNDPEFSRLTPELRDFLVHAFPNSTSTGRFEVRWRE